MEPMQFMAHHEASENAVVVRFEGEVDLSVADAFWSHLATAAMNAASTTPVRPLIIDLKAVDFLGSRGLRDLVRCYDEGASSGVAVGLVSAAGSIVAHVIHATAVDEILPLYPTVDDALRSLGRVKPG
jgi:anti-sigma B factor antagonist